MNQASTSLRRLPGVLDDGQEVRAFQAGDPEAFERLVDRHQRSILRFCHQLLGPGDEANDLFQEVFLQAYTALANLRDPGAFRTWLYRIALRRARRMKGRRRPHLVEDLGSEPAPDLPDPLVQNERIGALRRELGALPPRQREVVELRNYHGLSYAEIAEILGIQEDAARASHYQGLRRLRKILTEGESA